MQLSVKQLGIFSALVLVMAATRFNHFGSSISLPDASLAVFLLAGITMPRFHLQSLSVFVFLLLIAGGVDYYAINIIGVSDWCVTPAYWFLIPTYAVMWFGGSWFASKLQLTLHSFILFGSVSLLTTSVAFIISNVSFYLFSARFADMSITEYTERIAQYYSSYLSGSLLYLAMAAALYISLSMLNLTSTKQVNK